MLGRLLPDSTAVGDEEAVPIRGRADMADAPAASGCTTSLTECASPCMWLYVGLGARGLLYHALFARQLAAAILTGDESKLEQEATAWAWKTRAGIDR